MSRVEGVQKDSGARARRAREKDLSRARVPEIPFPLPFQRLRLKKKYQTFWIIKCAPFRHEIV